ncbi:hypothetical protein Pyrfu_0291 [Pyrolobus fumarii 1A]|uniref:Uncharacterized protein n=1 Tax=Pyrolobus fumarii (strain DSM 11204 / 1A) TaxID=694429 RepID=G0EFC0_PYRF1|nr:hypothetical protein [Pyrolobus fumarii]AEM38163.1 hypothetical protein Pyrfu_0291 [Pyrolobus fumarii 1A]
MSERLIIVLPSPRIHQHIAAALTIAGISIATGIISSMNPPCTITTCGAASIIGGLLAATGIFHRALYAKRTREKNKRVLILLSDLLREGVEGEPGRLLIASRYTGERLVKRCYTQSRVFRAAGDPIVLTIDSLAKWIPEYTLVVHGEEGFLNAETVRIEVEGVEAFVSRLHDKISIRLNRRRLTVRKGGEYAEAHLEANGPILSIVASHVGKNTRARLILEIPGLVENRAPLLEVKGRALHYSLSFAPRKPLILVLASTANIIDVARLLGYQSKPLVYGQGIEARIKLELLRGPTVLEYDETILRTMKSDNIHQ